MVEGCLGYVVVVVKMIRVNGGDEVVAADFLIFSEWR